MQELLATVEERSRQFDDFCALVRHVSDPILGENADLRVRVTEQDR
jgi:hypothetical protein